MAAKFDFLPPRSSSAFFAHVNASENRSGDRKALSIALGVAVIAHGLVFLIHLPQRPAPPSPAPRPEAPRITRTILRPPPVERPRVERRDFTRRLPLPDADPHDLWPVPERRVEISPTGPELNLDLRFAEIASDVPQPGGTIGPRVVGGDVLPPVLIDGSKIKPVYPELARMARYEGSVVLQAIVQADGTVGEIQILRVRPPDLGFEEAAIEALRQWRYRPATLDGRAVAVYFTVQVDFDLN